MTADTTRPIREYHWSADGKRVLYLQDRGGNENFHIYGIPVDAATPEEAATSPRMTVHGQSSRTSPATCPTAFLSRSIGATPPRSTRIGWTWPPAR